MSEDGPRAEGERQPDQLSGPRGAIERGLGVPGLFVAVYSSVGFSIYFALGVVADRGLGLTPVIFLAAGLLFVVTTLSYVEGGAMLRERGGSSSFARHAFNELIAFIAGWAILIDYLIVAALAAISVPHYLEPISAEFSRPGWEIGIASAVIVAACVLNALNITGRGRERRLAVLALADVALQLTVIGVGVLAVLNPDRLIDSIHLFTAPSVVDIVYASVVAMLAYAGIEAASDLAPDIDVHPRDLKRVVSVGALAVPLVYAGMAVVALMAVPVVAGPNGPHTELGSRYVEAPVLGIVSAFHPAGVADVMRWLVALIAAPVLFWAVTTAMLGVSRHIYTLAINRQIPSWLGKLSSRHATPQVAIAISGAIAIGLVAPTNVKLLAGYLRLRRDAGDHDRPALDPAPADHRARPPAPLRSPLERQLGDARLPVPALLAAVVSGLAFLSVLAFHETARLVGGGWMVFGLIFYVVYRKVFEGTSLTKRVSVTEQALTKKVPELAYRKILVPIFGSKLDDDIVSTAGRLAAAEQEDAGGKAGEARLDLVYVVEVPLSLPLDAPLPPDQEERARRALDRAREVGDEYEDVDVRTEVIRARKVGAGIVEAARRADSEAIVVGAEPPSRIRGGATMGGIGAAKPEEIGAATEYVLMKAPCRVLLTAPPEAVPEPEPEPEPGPEPEPTAAD